MAVLLVPAAGRSTRFGLARPKFLLQHPSGVTMLTAGLSGLAGLAESGISQILIVTLQEYFRDISRDKFRDQVAAKTGVPTQVMLLEDGTASMVETVCIGLDRLEHDDAVIIKDCDNLVAVDVKQLMTHDNALCFADLRDHPSVVAHNKSYLGFGPDLTLNNIVEKRIFGPYINVGCIKFAQASDFLSAAKALAGHQETYVSDVIRVLLDRDFLFKGLNVERYEDWGTLEEWRRYCRTYATVFVDLDGVVAANENPLSREGGWDRIIPIEDNCSRLLELQAAGRVTLVFTTSRTSEFRSRVEIQLKDLGFKSFLLITDLPHSQRILINDFAPTNPYPSALAVSIHRNSATLRDYLPDSLG